MGPKVPPRPAELLLPEGLLDWPPGDRLLVAGVGAAVAGTLRLGTVVELWVLEEHKLVPEAVVVVAAGRTTMPEGLVVVAVVGTMPPEEVVEVVGHTLVPGDLVVVGEVGMMLPGAQLAAVVEDTMVPEGRVVAVTAGTPVEVVQRAAEVGTPVEEADQDCSSGERSRVVAVGAAVAIAGPSRDSVVDHYTAVWVSTVARRKLDAPEREEEPELHGTVRLGRTDPAAGDDGGGDGDLPHPWTGYSDNSGSPRPTGPPLHHRHLRSRSAVQHRLRPLQNLLPHRNLGIPQRR